MPKCSNCGFENPEDARFCNQCGNQLEESTGHHGERKQISVVFSDLSGFTALSEHLDPEDLRGLMERIFSKATEIIERYSGRVDKLLGDAVMSVFGDPVAHEDDAERAVRAAREIHAFVDDLSREYEPIIGRPLSMHSGINTGVVVTSSGAFDTADTGPLGDTINLAARLEDLSEAGEILLGPETSALVEDVFELSDYGTHELKGKSGPVQVWEVTGLRHERAGPSRRQAGFVGRHEELGILLASVEKVQDGEGSVIGIRAEAGAGKTRLLDEFHTQVRDKVQWLEGRAYPYGENIPYAALVDLISNAVGIGEKDTQDSMAEKLRSEIGVLVEDTDRVLDPFVRLYGLPEREDSALDKDSFQDRLLESLSAVVEGLCRRGPTVLVLQDLHWADPSTVAIVSDLIETMRATAVIVANYRPSFTGKLPRLREIDLSPLSPRQAGEMVESLLQRGSPPRELIDFVVDRTDGNPFYVEEIINSLIETGNVAFAGGSWQVTGSLAESDLPTSVRGVIAARIDRLDGDRRQVLREASVVGREFLYEVIRRVATRTETLDPSLADLETADLIRERQRDADLEYFFKHALTQDVAYEGLLKKERTTLHARAAAAIEAQFVDRLEEVTETLAFHYTQGEVRDKAVHYLRAAGRKAMDRYALIEAQAHFETAYRLLTGGEERGVSDRALVELILDWALLFYYQARLLELDDLLVEHQGAVDGLDDERLRMWWMIWRGHAAGFRLDQADNTRFLDEAVVIAERIGDQTGKAYARTWQVWAHFVAGRPEAAIEAGREIEDWVTAHRREDPYPYFKSRVTLAFALVAAGQTDEVTEICKQVIAFGEQVGNNRCIAYGYQGLAFLATNYGNLTEAVALAKKASSIAKDPIYRDTAYLNVVAAAALMGDAAEANEAIAVLRQAEEQGTELPAPLFVSIGESVAAMMEGRLSGAMERILEIRDQAARLSRVWEQLFAEFFIGGTYARLVTGEAAGGWRNLARNPGFISHALRAKREALPLVERSLELALRHGYKGSATIAEVELAKLHIHRGEKDKARKILEVIADRVSILGEGEGVDRVRELLAQT